MKKFYITIMSLLYPGGRREDSIALMYLMRFQLQI